MIHVEWLVAYLSFCATCAKQRQEISHVLGVDIEFLPRAVTYLSHLFPLKDDSTSFTFEKDESTVAMEDLFKQVKIIPLLKSRLSNSSGEGGEYDAAAIDRVFWRDVPTHLHTNEFKDIEQISTFHLANAALRRTEYNKKSCDDENFQGFGNIRVIQTYVERGVPFEVPCYSCEMSQAGLTTVFYMLPSRNFMYGINLQDRKETFNTSSEGLLNQLSSWLLHEIKYDHYKGKLNYDTQFVFGVGRASGGHTPVHLQSIIGDDHGRLQINVVNMSYIVNSVRHQEVASRLSFYEKFFGGLTIVCAQMVDNEPRSLGFVHNIDYFVNADEDLFFLDSMKYENYVTIDSSPSNLPYLNETMNIKIAITWEEWSCCSACCCSVALCGLYSNAKKCDEIHSYRERRGFLSVFLLNPEKPLRLPNKKVSHEMDKILRVSPYREDGIAIFSSFILRTPRFRKHFWEDVLKHVLNDKLRALPDGVVFIEEQDCTEMPQKTNCSVLAACRGQGIDEPPPSVEEQVIVDPCTTVPMTVLSITESSVSFRFETNTSYRLRLDGLDKKHLQSVTWEIGGQSVAPYNFLKACHQQGIVVHPNAFDLILIEPNETEVVGPLIEASTSRQQFKIKFLLDTQEDKLLEEESILMEKVGIIGVSIVTVLAVLVLIHNYMREKGITGTGERRRKKEASENQGKRK